MWQSDRPLHWPAGYWLLDLENSMPVGHTILIDRVVGQVKKTGYRSGTELLVNHCFSDFFVEVLTYVITAPCSRLTPPYANQYCTHIFVIIADNLCWKSSFTDLSVSRTVWVVGPPVSLLVGVCSLGEVTSPSCHKTLSTVNLKTLLVQNVTVFLPICCNSVTVSHRDDISCNFVQFLLYLFLARS